MRSEQKVNEVLVRDVLQTNHGEVKLTQGKKNETNVNTLTCTLHSRPKWGKSIIHFHRKPQKNDSSLFSGKSLRVCRKNSQEHIETVASNIRMSNKRILPWTLAGRKSHWTGLCSQGSIPTESDAISISLRVLRSSKISVRCTQPIFHPHHRQSLLRFPHCLRLLNKPMLFKSSAAVQIQLK